MAGLGQGAHHVGADVAGAARDEDLHAAALTAPDVLVETVFPGR